MGIIPGLVVPAPAADDPLPVMDDLGEVASFPVLILDVPNLVPPAGPVNDGLLIPVLKAFVVLSSFVILVLEVGLELGPGSLLDTVFILDPDTTAVDPPTDGLLDATVGPEALLADNPEGAAIPVKFDLLIAPTADPLVLGPGPFPEPGLELDGLASLEETPALGLPWNRAIRDAPVLAMEDFPELMMYCVELCYSIKVSVHMSMVYTCVRCTDMVLYWQAVGGPYHHCQLIPYRLL